MTKLRLKSRLICAAALIAGYGASAHADPVTRIYKFTATDFSSIIDPGVVSPYTTVTGQFTLTFDPLVSQSEGTDGITLDSLSIPLGSAVAFRYDYISVFDVGVIQIGGSQNGVAGTGGIDDDFALSFQWTGNGPPHFGGFNYSNGSVFPNEVFVAGSGSVQAVPEPASWALMLAGFGMIGGTLRRRSMAAAEI